jgi:nucleoside-diphosphate-sugar epimerase
LSPDLSSLHLLIAGRGYLGREVARQATARGWTVSALSKSGDENAVACDLSDREALTTLKSQIPDPDSIVLCASSGRGGPEAYRAVFLDGSRHLLDAFPGAHLLFVSSTSVYGQTDGSLVTEESPAEPETETSRLLLAAESCVLSAGGTAARLVGLYGPGRSVILRRFLEGQAVIEEDGRRFLNQIHRDDAASALLHLASHPEWSRAQVYNVADSTPLLQGDCYRALAQLFRKPLPSTGPRPERRKRAWTHKRVSNEKLRATGWDPAYPSFLDAVADVARTF